MSIFKTNGIILKKIHKSKDLIYIVFSSDYGKIAVISKKSNKEKKLDIGYDISFELKIKGEKEIFNIRNIKILSNFNYLDFSFETINNYQILLSLIYKLAPEKKQIFNIYEIIQKINNIEITNLTEEKEKKINSKIILASLKILNIFGLLDLEHKNNEIKKILYFINNNSFSRIFMLVGIKEDILKIFEKIILENITNKKSKF